MLKTIPFFLITILIYSCKTNADQSPQKAEVTKAINDTVPMVTGIGGVFFLSDDPKEMREWYAKNLGLKMNDWGSSTFEYRNLNNPDKTTELQWMPFSTESDYFAPSKKEYMINYTVQNLDGLIEKLLANKVTFVDSLVTYEYGKFIHILDSQGNKIELWEPINNEQND